MIRVNIISVIVIVTIVALVGMVLGGGFGYAAGRTAPDLFLNLVPWDDIEPVGTATVIGAFGGVLCGGALGAFAVFLQAVTQWLTGRRESK